ncbi:hypothetical protein [Microvirga flavescens]|uniref:hypothetical protein n=1 Tax=Microvirga flavescens TaxID=2249811 RepID=UPI001300294D|nr:hypothetical protein [Microvirga flavescens]
MTRKIQIPPGLKKRAHQLYFHNPEVALPAIAALLGMTEATFRRYRENWKWPPRREALAQARREKATASRDVCDPSPVKQELAASQRDEGPKLRDAALSLVRITQTRIDALAARHAAGQVQDDKAAKLLTDYAKTLATAQALLKHETTKRDEVACDDDDGRSIHELRDELGRHLEQLVAEQEASRSDGGMVEG